MAYKSILLSLLLTALVGYTFTAGITNPHSLIRKLPGWTTIPLVVGIFALYLLAGWWAVRGLGEHKLISLFSLGLCALGFGLYAFVLSCMIGKGKASPGQYDYTIAKMEPSEKAVLEQIAQNAGLSLEDAVFSEHWHLSNDVPGFRICVQKGHVTAFLLSNKKITNLALFTQLPQLSDLYLDNCGLFDMSALHLEKLDRLELPNNQISDLKTLRGCPNIRWLVLRNNKLHSSEGIELFPKLVSQDLSGNHF